jgi:sorbose reductase
MHLPSPKKNIWTDKMTQIRGVLFPVQLATKQMQKQGNGGSMVLIASQCAHVAIPGYRIAAYNASKGAVKMLAKALAVKLAKFKIQVNTISPRFADSDMTKAVRDLKNAIEGEQMWKVPPLKRIGTQNDLTGAVVYLLSDASSYVTAVDIPIEGGVQAEGIEVED